MSDINIVAKEISCMFSCWEDLLKILKRTVSVEDYQKAEEYYSKLNVVLRKYTAELTKDIIERSSYDNALKSKKVDPYVAGGIADGIAGVGAGVYAAANMADRNERIDAARKEGETRVRQQQQFTSKSEMQLIEAFNTLKNHVFTVPEAKEFYLTAWQEQQAKEKTVKKKNKAFGIVFWVVFFIIGIAYAAVIISLDMEINYFLTFAIVVLDLLLSLYIAMLSDKLWDKIGNKSDK